MKKSLIKKVEPFEHMYGFQKNWLDGEESFREYIRRLLLASMPPNATSENYPFLKIDNGMAIPHEIFRPIFKGDLPILKTTQAQALFATKLGFDIKSGLPCVIKNDSDGGYVIILYPTHSSPYQIDYTGRRLEG